VKRELPSFLRLYSIRGPWASVWEVCPDVILNGWLCLRWRCQWSQTGKRGQFWPCVSTVCICVLRGWVQINATFCYLCAYWGETDFPFFSSCWRGLHVLLASDFTARTESRRQILTTASFGFSFSTEFVWFFSFVYFQNKLISSENSRNYYVFFMLHNFDKGCLRELIRSRIVVTLPYFISSWNG
jgi:hypothetical protein